MPAPLPIDHYALFDDIIAVAASARSPTAGWKAICVRAQRTIGKRLALPLTGLDLDEEIDPLGVRVRAIAAHAPFEVDTLVFGLFDGVHVTPSNGCRGSAEGGTRDDGSGVYTGFHLMGTNEVDKGARWLTKAPIWKPADRFLASPALDAIARAGTEARGEPKKALTHALRFGAAALLARFSSEGLHHRIIVTFDDGDFAEVRAPVKL